MITADQIKAARILLGWTKAMLADKANVLTSAVEGRESRQTAEDRRRMQVVLKAAGIEFTSGEPGARMRNTV